MKKTAGRLALAAAGFVAACTIFAIAETLARRLLPPMRQLPTRNARYERFMEESSRPLFRVEVDGGKPVLVQQAAAWQPVRGQRLPLRPQPGVRRILVTGESSAEFLGAAMDSAIRREGRFGSLEILNCAVGGASLEIARERFHECMRYSPDAIVALFGNNLYYDDLAHTRTEFLLSQLARRSRLLTYLADDVLPRRGDESTFLWSERLLLLERFLREVARDARTRRIPAVVVTIPGNLWQPPAILAPDQSDAGYESALALHDRGQTRAADAAIRALLARRPSAWWHFTLGRWLYQEGDFAGARRHLRAARDLDPWRNRASSSVNDLIREVSVAQGLRVLDAEALVAAAAPHGIPGAESFADRQHVKPAVFDRLAAQCLRELRTSRQNGGRPPL